MKKFEFRIAYCDNYYIEEYEIEAKSKKEALKKANDIELKHTCEAILWEDINEIKE